MTNEKSDEELEETIEEYEEDEEIEALEEPVEEKKEEPVLINVVEEGVSPTPPKIKEMDFPDALREVIAGKKITKLEWCNKAVYGELKDERLVLWKEDGKMYHWLLSEGDAKGEDWVVIE